MSSPIRTLDGVDTDPSQTFSTSASTSDAAILHNTSHNTYKNNTVQLGISKKCPITTHEKGHYCLMCKSVATGWSEIPWKNDEAGNRIIVGPKGGLLEGAALDDEESVAVICIEVYACVKSIPSQSIPDFAIILKRHPNSVIAGKRIAAVYFECIKQASSSQLNSDILSFWSVIDTALKSPGMKPEACLAYILKKSETVEGDNTGDEGEEADSGLHGEREGEVPDKELAGEAMTGPELWVARSFPTQNEAHKPAENGTWTIAEGVDKSKAVVGKPEPHKFFILRQDQKDLEHFDIRQYPHIRTFDWNEPSHIDALNKNRTQIFGRTEPRTDSTRPQWSLKEKNVFEELIKTDLQSDKTKFTLDWDDISKRLQYKFVGVTQNVGEPLALTSKKVNGVGWITAKRTNPKICTARFGPVVRSGNALKAQATKFRSIAELLDRYPGTPKSGKRAIKHEEDFPGSSSAPIFLNSSSENITTLKKRKVGGGVNTQAALRSEEDIQDDYPLKKRNIPGAAVHPTDTGANDNKEVATSPVVTSSVVAASVVISSPVVNRPEEDNSTNMSNAQGQAAFKLPNASISGIYAPRLPQGNLVGNPKGGDKSTI